MNMEQRWNDTDAKIEVFEEKVSLCSPHVLHGMAWYLSRAFAVNRHWQHLIENKTKAGGRINEFQTVCFLVALCCTF